MNKEEARYLVGLGYRNKINGENSFTINSETYTFTNGIETLNGLNLARQSAVLNGSNVVKFKDIYGVYEIPLDEFDELLKQMILAGNSLWENKVNRYFAIDSLDEASDEFDEDAQAIIDLPWE